MPSYNKCILMGHLARDPQSKQLPGGSSVAEFGLAVNHKFKSRDGTEREEVLFIDCAAFGRSGEVIAQFCKKGKAILVEGRLKLDQWDDKQSGAKRSKISLIVDNFQFVGGRGDDEGGQAQTPQRQSARAGGGSRPKQSTPWREEQGDESGMDPSDIPFAFEWHRTPI